MLANTLLALLLVLVLLGIEHIASAEIKRHDKHDKYIR